MAKVLIVDNDRTTVSLLKILLELDGHSVEAAGVPDTFLADVRRVSPDVVLMDVFLAGGDGLELLRQMRAEAPLAGVPVLMCSGMNLAEECAAAGANGFLLKPYTPEQLSSSLAAALGSATPPSAPALGREA
ncbi:MAG TPA: response regulator [Anaerolineales bacterium]|nr:response regulator [Anaerolineales bacterium]